MVVSFRKATTTPKEFQLSSDKIEFKGEFKKVSRSLVEINSKISGDIITSCSRCLEDISFNINLEYDIMISDGLYNNPQKESNIIEIFDGNIDFNSILNSELELIKSDYYLCNICNTHEDFEKEY